MNMKTPCLFALAFGLLGHLNAQTNIVVTNTVAIPTHGPSTNVVVIVTPAVPDAPVPTNGLYLNFHDMPLNAVLNYLSSKAGLTIISDVDLSGKVSLVALHPLTTNEVITLLNMELSKNNYTATLNDKTLSITSSDKAKSAAPIQVGRSPKDIPVDAKIVTEILPVHTLNAQQLIKDLEKLIPSGDDVTANEAGNAVIMTAPQKDAHRISEIISALDSSALSDVAVFFMHYGDSKSVASELKEIFQSADSEVAGAARGASGGGSGRMRFGGFPGMGGSGGESESSKNSTTHAVFANDDQANAVIASAPPD
jgi:type II secretory pathway component GspD/PulD (secretin)